MTIKNTLIRVGRYQPRRRGQVERVFTQAEVDAMVSAHKEGRSILVISREHRTHVLHVIHQLSLRGIDTGFRARPGRGHHAFRTGRYLVRGGYYKVLLRPGDPMFEMADKNGTVFEHRLVMAQSLGRPLHHGETVHHIDGNPGNNALSNLQLRQGKHGKGWVMACLDCGSHRIGPASLAG